MRLLQPCCRSRPPCPLPRRRGRLCPSPLLSPLEEPIDVATFNRTEDLTLSIEALNPAQQPSADVVYSNVLVGASQVTVELSPTVEGRVNVTIGDDVVADAAVPYRGNSPASIAVDYTTPIPTAVLYLQDNQDTTAAYPFRVFIAFSKDVTISDQTKLSVTNGNITAAGVTGGPSTFSFDVTPSSDVVTIKANEGLAVDSASKPNQESLQLVVTFDYIGSGQALDWIPTVDLTASSLVNTASFPVNMRFSTSTTTNKDFTQYFMVDGEKGDVTSWERISGRDFRCTILVPNAKTGGGTVEVYLAERAAEDNKGLTNQRSNTITVEFDPIPPTIALSSTSGPKTRQQQFNVTVTVADDNFVLASQPLGASTFTLTNAAILSIDGDLVRLEAVAEGNVEVKIDAGKIVDLAGNGNTQQASFTVIFG
ncbi:unnamed protein product [Vitrella brassicaformis CCMP3155]|uniref:Uncharacterized protein n=1 Tax=Vitrella brassicaformis (strain CCMP3155) TaxID=1169540 RepID=A0A0G4EM16_VITBC|nr:unnamed protein product [Vitrella brassicaformis CCMP3155]|eukprot:CEL98178.1 unnamed protein product [Vitrella brassicaformis CCMP3155]